MITLESLRAFGASVDAGLERCLNKEDFYLKMVNMALADQRTTRPLKYAMPLKVQQVTFLWTRSTTPSAK